MPRRCHDRMGTGDTAWWQELIQDAPSFVYVSLVPLDSAQPCRCMPRCVLPASSAISANLTKWFNQGQSRWPSGCLADSRCSPLCGAPCKFPWVSALVLPWLIVSSQSAPHPQPPDNFFSPDVYLHVSVILPTWMNLVVS